MSEPVQKEYKPYVVVEERISYGLDGEAMEDGQYVYGPYRSRNRAVRVAKLRKKKNSAWRQYRCTILPLTKLEPPK